MGAVAGGCSSVISGGLAILMIAALVIGSIILAKRKESK